jgi:chromosomal replication initiator protein
MARFSLTEHNFCKIQIPVMSLIPASLPSITAEELAWPRVCQTLRDRVGDDAYERWFSPARLLACNQIELRLTVPNQIHQFWIESNFANLLQAALIEHVGGTRRLIMTVDQLAGGPAELMPCAVTQSAPAVVVEAAGPTLESGMVRPTLENFVIGPSNQFAQAAAQAVADKPGRIYNPLFIYGGSGLGKTHLLHAISHRVQATRAKAKVVYVTCEQFTNDFIEAVQTGQLPKFRARYRKADVLLIDDIQFLGGKERSQDEFFHTFNSLFDGHKQIVLASDKPPSEIAQLEARLVSRFEWGITAQLDMPDIETRTAIVRSKLANMEVQLPPEIVHLLVSRIRHNIRRLEGGLMRLASFASLSPQPLTVAKAEELLRDLSDQDARPTITIDRIQRAVAEAFDVRLADMSSKRRPASIAFPRQIAMYLARELTQASFTEIGQAFGGRDHGTVIHACKLVGGRMTDDGALRSRVNALEHKLRQP